MNKGERSSLGCYYWENISESIDSPKSVMAEYWLQHHENVETKSKIFEIKFFSNLCFGWVLLS